VTPDLLPGALAWVWRWDDDREVLHPVAAPPDLPEPARAAFLRMTASLDQSPEFSEVLRTEQPFSVTDVTADLRVNKSFWSSLGIPCFILAPLLAGDRLLGLIAFGRKQPGAFSPRDVELIQGTAQRVAMALQGDQAREEAQRQLDHVRLLNQIIRAIAERQHLAKVFHVVLEHLEDFLPVDLGVICLAEAAANGFIIAACGRKSAPVAAPLGLDETKTLATDRTSFRQCLMGHMVYEANTATAASPLSRAMAEAGLQSVVATPLMIEDRLLGILLTARRSPDGFSSSDCEFLRMLSEHVAIAADDARLRDNLQAAYDELRETHRSAMQQERLRALGQMASGVAHDINNALSPIAGYAEMLLSDEEGITPRGRRYVEIIQTACGDIIQIVARLRDFYRQRGQRDHFAPINIEQVVRQVVELTRPRWRDIPQQQGHVVDLRTDMADDLPPLMGIESEIREALTNLVINAVDAMPHGGTVTLRARVGKEDPDAAAPSQSHIVIEVADTGVGMDEETLRRCLEPFYSTKGEHGTGLGLSLVYGAMQRHEGDIQIESASGKGTTIRLILPIRDVVQPASAAQPKTGPSPTPLHILCIDDEPLLRNMVRDMLERDGHRVELADGGQSGLDAFHAARKNKTPFDVVITDLGMPHVGGHEVVRHIKRDSPNTPVIVMTGWGSRIGSDAGHRPDADFVMGKPPKLQELRRLLALVRANQT
jgi:signal transduction histidine kinase/ActR/RegA family two-component response regulator